jgi:hypothetical protein
MPDGSDGSNDEARCDDPNEPNLSPDRVITVLFVHSLNSTDQTSANGDGSHIMVT